MSSHRRFRLPISTRHAFALAFDLAVRRDAWSSLVVPLLLRAPWILALAALPAPMESDRPGLVVGLTAAALIGDFVMLVLIGAMLRFRALSVFNTAVDVRPAKAIDCYAHGLRRMPWLIVTEIVRNVGIVFASVFFVLPGVLLGFRLSFATEAVVLHAPNTEAAFRSSFHLTPGRLERWLEMIVGSVLLVLGVVFVPAVLSALVRGVAIATWVAVARLLVTAVTPIIQYAWTFFYLRLFEIEPHPRPYEEPGPLYAEAGGAPHAATAGNGAAVPPASEPYAAMADVHVPEPVPASASNG